MNPGEKSPLEAASDVLENLQDQAQDMLGDLAENAENMADSVLGEAKVDQIKEVLNTDVGELAQDLMDKVTGKDKV